MKFKNGRPLPTWSPRGWNPIVSHPGKQHFIVHLETRLLEVATAWPVANSGSARRALLPEPSPLLCGWRN